MRYFFIFGNHPMLSSAELTAVLGGGGFIFEMGYCVFEREQELDLTDLQERLGGVVKCGVVLKNTSRTSLFDDAYQDIHASAQRNQKFS